MDDWDARSGPTTSGTPAERSTWPLADDGAAPAFSSGYLYRMEIREEAAGLRDFGWDLAMDGGAAELAEVVQGRRSSRDPLTSSSGWRPTADALSSSSSEEPQLPPQDALELGDKAAAETATAGMEASGTSNMKFSMNGCVLIGTLDGANVEIREEVGEENFFLFGARAHEIADLRKERAKGKFVPDPRFVEVKKYVRTGVFEGNSYDELLGSLEGNEGYGRGDYFLVGKDFPSYIECQENVDEAYRDQKKWTRMSIMNTAGSAKFSSDRTIHEYAKDIWGINPLPLS